MAEKISVKEKKEELKDKIPNQEDILDQLQEEILSSSNFIIPKNAKKKELIEIYEKKYKDLGEQPPYSKNKVQKMKKNELIDIINDADYANDLPVNLEGGYPMEYEDLPEEPKPKITKITKRIKTKSGELLYRVNVGAIGVFEAMCNTYDPTHEILDIRGLNQDFLQPTVKKEFVECYSEVADEYPLLAKYLTHWSATACINNASLISQRNTINQKKKTEISPPSPSPQ